MLSERERRVLWQIEAGMVGRDPRFVAAMRTGRPRAPREYRRTWLVALLVMAIASLAALLVTGHPAALVALVVVLVASLIRFATRKLDRP